MPVTIDEEHKSKMSEIAKTSKKVNLANADPNKKLKLKNSVKKQKLNGKLNWSKLHTKESEEKRKQTLKLKREDWVNNLDKTIKSEYRKACKFRFNLKDYPDNFDFWLIEQYGWYKAKNKGDNLGGVSRDHMLSVSEGFELGIDPFLLAHPANCKLLIHTDNISKNKKSTITFDELLNRIKNFDEKYGK